MKHLWRYEVVILGNQSGSLLFGTSKHLFRKYANRAAGDMRRVIGMVPETAHFSVEVKQRGWQHEYKKHN